MAKYNNGNVKRGDVQRWHGEVVLWQSFTIAWLCNAMALLGKVMVLLGRVMYRIAMAMFSRATHWQSYVGLSIVLAIHTAIKICLAFI